MNALFTWEIFSQRLGSKELCLSYWLHAKVEGFDEPLRLLVDSGAISHAEQLLRVTRS